MRKTAILTITAIALAGFLALPVQADDTAEAGGQVVQADHYSVTVPDEIAELSVIDVNGDAISFSEKIAHEGNYGGFVGEIELYSSMKDYAGMPEFERAGEITTADGTKYDVLLQYPTDVQFDLENEESKANYNTISEAFRSTIKDSITPIDGTFTPQDEIDTDGIYAELLEKLKADIAEQKDAEALTADDFCYLYSYYYDGEEPAESALGYAYMDYNHDGYDELLIGDLDEPLIYDMYTQVDGEVFHLICAGERDVYNIVSNDGKNPGLIRETASGGAFTTLVKFYILDSAAEELGPQLTYAYDENAGPKKVYTIIYGEDTEAEPITEDEWYEGVERGGAPLKIEFTAFAAE